MNAPEFLFVGRQRVPQALEKVIEGLLAPQAPPAGDDPLHLHVNNVSHLLLAGGPGENIPPRQDLGQRPQKTGHANSQEAHTILDRAQGKGRYAHAR